MKEDQRIGLLIAKHRSFLEMEDAESPLFFVRKSWDHRPPPFLAQQLGEGELVDPRLLDPELGY